ALATAGLACGGGGLFGPPEPTLPAPQQWRQNVTTSLISVPVIDDGMLIYAGQSGDIAQDVFGRDAATGELQWTYELSSNFISDHPLWVDSGLVFLTHNVREDDSLGVGRLLALDTRSGALRWDYRLGETWQDSLSSFYPAAAEGRVYVETGYGTDQHRL